MFADLSSTGMVCTTPSTQRLLTGTVQQVTHMLLTFILRIWDTISTIPPHSKTAIIFSAVYHPSNAVKTA